MNAGENIYAELGRKNVILEKSFQLALAGIAISKLLTAKADAEMASQIRRSSSSVGAQIREAQEAQSGRDFIHKLSLGLKEVREFNYWIRLAEASNTLSPIQTKQSKELSVECYALLTSIISTRRRNMGAGKK